MTLEEYENKMMQHGANLTTGWLFRDKMRDQIIEHREINARIRAANLRDLLSKGADVSAFGNPVQWQTEQRAMVGAICDHSKAVMADIIGKKATVNFSKVLSNTDPLQTILIVPLAEDVEIKTEPKTGQEKRRERRKNTKSKPSPHVAPTSGNPDRIGGNSELSDLKTTHKKKRK